jgi:hypothetical protein
MKVYQFVRQPLPDPSAMLYQGEMGSMLYAAITTRPDIAFAVTAGIV